MFAFIYVLAQFLDFKLISAKHPSPSPNPNPSPSPSPNPSPSPEILGCLAGLINRLKFG